MNLQLSRPIVFFDLETTGLNIGRDHIIQISLIKLFPDGRRDKHTTLVNPGMHIPEDSTAVHHITDEMVADKPHFKDIARSIANYIKGCDLAGFNSNRFDIPMLAEEFLANGLNDVNLRSANFIDVQNIFHKMEPRTLVAALKFYCNKDYEDKAHDAEEDTMATIDVFLAQMEKYKDLPHDMKSLAEMTAMNRNVDFAGRMIYNDNNVEIFNFGKHKGKPVEQVLKQEPSYYDWMMNGDFPLETKQVLTTIRIRMSK